MCIKLKIKQRSLKQTYVTFVDQTTIFKTFVKLCRSNNDLLFITNVL